MIKIRATALAAAGSASALRIQDIVILAVSCLSSIGALSIILSFLLFPRLRTIRHQLILGLAISDLIMALNFLSSTAADLSGHSIGSKQMRSFCLFNGFMTQFFVIQTDYWILTIAICTYFTVGGYQKASKWVQSHRIIVFAMPPGVSIIWALIGLGLKAYDNIGGWCWFPSDRTRLLVNFIPRWIIVISCLLVYLHLFITIFRTQRQAASNANDESWLSTENDTKEKQIIQKTGISSGTDSINSGNLLKSSAMPSQTSSQRLNRMSSSSQYSLAPALKKIAYQMMMYPLIYMLIWSIPTAVRIYQSTTHKAAPTAVGTIDKACIVVQGVADALVYGHNERSIAAWGDLFSRLKRFGSR